MALSARQPGSASTPSTLGTRPGAVSALSIGRTGYCVLSMYQYHSKVTDPALDGIKWNDWKIKLGPTPVVANWDPEDSVQCSLKTQSSQSKHQQKCKEPPIATTSCPFGTYQKHQIFSRGVAPNIPKCFHFSCQQLQQQLLTNVRLPRTSRSGVWAPASPRQYNPHAPWRKVISRGVRMHWLAPMQMHHEAFVSGELPFSLTFSNTGVIDDSEIILLGNVSKASKQPRWKKSNLAVIIDQGFVANATYSVYSITVPNYVYTCVIVY